MASAGAVAWQFDRKGQIIVKTDGMDPDDLLLLALDAGAEDLEINDDGSAEIITADTDLAAVRDSLLESGVQVESAELTMVPRNEIKLPLNQAMKVMNLIEQLEDLDDVQQVNSNLAFDDALLNRLEAA